MIASIACVALTALPAVDWPCWRGADGTGVSPETDWSTEGTVAWRANVGAGHSCVSIADGLLYTLGFDEEREIDTLHCLKAESGEPVWAREFPGSVRSAGHGGGTLTTPTVDGERVFVSNRDGVVRAFDALDGTPVWQVDLAETVGAEPTEYGFGGSPLAVDDRLIVNANKTVALEARTGALLWQTRDHLAMYSTPTKLSFAGHDAAAVFTKEGLFVLATATGAELVHYPWRKGNPTVNASSPVLVGERLFISSAYNHGCALLEAGDEGLEPVWESKVLRTKLAGASLFDGHLYGFDEKVFKCVDLAGKEQWRKRGFGMGAFSIGGERLIVLGEKGELVIAEATPERFKELSKVRALDRGPCWTAPVLADGRIYCRNGNGDVVCLDFRRRDE